MDKKVLLRVKRFCQHENECAIASVASLANFYDKNIKYDNIRHHIPYCLRRNGLYTSQQAKLLNAIHFKNVTIVTSDLDIVDYSWSKLSRYGLSKKLIKLYRYYNRTKNLNGNSNDIVYDLYQWLSNKNFNNKIIIDNDFAKYIKKCLDSGHPVCASVNATSMFKMKKWSHCGDSDIKGQRVDHAIVIRGYDSKYVYIVDSDHGFGRRISLRKYVTGYYRISWEKLLTNIPCGDLIFVS